MSCSPHRGNRDADSTFSAFSLVELLVVIAIIAFLISLLLPSLAAAREQARSATCGKRLRDLGNGLHTYMTEEQDWIPGCNTSGLEAFAKSGTPAMHAPRVPVQNYDWITPSLCRSIEMKSPRARRFREIVEDFACPSQRTYKSVLYPGEDPPPPADLADFRAEGADLGGTGWTTISYLMPSHFQFWGTQYRNDVLGFHEINGTAYRVHTASPAWEAENRTYKSRLALVGSPARKIAAADGTRYVTDASGWVDFDISNAPYLFGSFTSQGAWWCGSTEYGVRRGTLNWSGRTVYAGPTYPPGNGANLTFSYRHGPGRGAGLSGTAAENRGRINALFFDGSVRQLDDKASRNPIYWYPSGTIVKRAAEGMIDDLRNDDVIP